MDRLNYTTLEDVNEIVGFFTVYNARKHEHLTQLFGDLTETDIEDLNNLLTDIYGEYLISKRFEKIFYERGAENLMLRVVNICDMIYFDTWKALKNAIDKGLATDIETPMVETKDTTRNTKLTDSHVTQNKENAFDNTQSPSDTDRSEYNGINTENEGVKTVWKRSNNRTPTQTAQNVIDFSRLNDYIKIIIDDISNTLCVKIG